MNVPPQNLNLLPLNLKARGWSEVVRCPLVSRHCQMCLGARWTWIRTSHQLVYGLRFTTKGRQRANLADGIFPHLIKEEGFAHIHNNNFEVRTNLQGASSQEHICSQHFHLLSEQNPESLVWPSSSVPL